MKRQAIVIAFITLFAIFLSLEAGAATSSVLTLGGGARSAGLRGSMTAAAGDLDNLFYNPGGLSALTKSELSVTHADLLLGSAYDLVSYGHRLKTGAVAVALLHSGTGSIDGRDGDGRPNGDFSVDDTVGSVAFSKSLGAAGGLGVGAKFIRSRIGSDSASTFALDVGGVYRLQPRRVWVGAAVLNVGPGLRYRDERSDLPLTLSAGVAAQIQAPLKFAVDLRVRPNDDRVEFTSGIEFAALSSVSLRAGHLAPLSGGRNSATELSGIHGGIGLRFQPLRLDYAVSPFADLGVVQRFSVSVSF